MKRCLLFALRLCSVLLVGSYFHTSARGQWLPEVLISTSDTNSSLNENMGQCLAVSGDSIHVVWWANSTPSITSIFYKHSFDGGKTWSDETALSSPTHTASFPSIAVNGNTVHIAYRDTTNGSADTTYTTLYLRSTDGGVTWQAPVSLGTFYWWPSITCNGGMVFIALNANAPGNSEVYFRRSMDDGITWDSTIQISNAPMRSEDPSIAAASGCVHIAWNDNRTGIMQTWYRRSSDNGATWGPETQLTNAPLFAYFPMVHASGPDVNLVRGDRQPNNNYNICYQRSTDFGAHWDSSTALTFNAVSAYPVIAGDSINLHMVWFDFNGDVYYMRSTNSGNDWDSAVSLVSYTMKPSNPFIKATGNSLDFIWKDAHTGHEEVYFQTNPTGNTFANAGVGSYDAQSGLNLSAYPNPSSGNVTVSYQALDATRASIAIYDNLGRILRKFEANSKIGTVSRSVDLSNLPRGAYICRVTASSGSASRLILVE